MSEDIIIPLSSEHIRMLGGSEEHIAEAQAREDKAAQEAKDKEVKVQTIVGEPETKQDTKPVESKETVPSKTAEVPAAKEVPAETTPTEPLQHKFEEVMDALNKEITTYTDAEEKAIVDEQLAKVIDEKFDTYKNLSTKELAETLMARAEKAAKVIIEEKRAVKAKEAALAVKTEEAQKNLKEVNTFVSPSALSPNAADEEKELTKRAEQGDDEAISELFSRRRKYTINE